MMMMITMIMIKKMMVVVILITYGQDTPKTDPRSLKGEEKGRTSDNVIDDANDYDNL